MRRSQVSLFVIIGIIIVIVAAFFAVRLYQNRIDQIKTPVDFENKKIQPIIDYVDECIKMTAIDGMTLLGQQGMIDPNVYVASSNIKIAYFYYEGKGYFPEDIHVIEDELSGYIRDNVVLCTQDFSGTGFTVKADESKTQVITRFKDSEVDVRLTYPITVLAGGEERYVTDFDAQVSSRFKSIYSLAEKIYTETKNNPDWVNLDIFASQPYQVKIIKVNNAILVYEITDTAFGLDNKPYMYRFAVKYKVQ